MTVRTKFKLSIALWFLVGFPLLILSVEGCSMQKRPNHLKEDSLRIRVQQFYDYFTEKRFDKCYDFLPPKEVTVDKKEFIEISKRYFQFRITDYKIESVSLEESNARVEMYMSVIENDKEYPYVHFDYWLFTDGSWYLASFGRTE